MSSKLWELDLSVLRSMYEKEKSDLNRALLNGASWEEMKDQRRLVTELSIALHKRMMRDSNPAEVPTRKNRDSSSESM